MAISAYIGLALFVAALVIGEIRTTRRQNRFVSEVVSQLIKDPSFIRRVRLYMIRTAELSTSEDDELLDRTLRNILRK